MKQVLVCNYPLEQYPPIYNIINNLLIANFEVVYIGLIKNVEKKKMLEKQGILYYELDLSNNEDSKFSKFKKIYKNSYSINKILYNSGLNNNNSKIWLFGEQTIWNNHNLISNYKVISYLFEMPSFSLPLRYRVIFPFINYKKILQKSYKVVSCEDTRALITKYFFKLKVDSIVIPNKNINDINDIKFGKTDEIDKFLHNFSNKKIILYQGIFNYPERRIEELCKSINYLGNEFVIVLVGGNGKYEELKKKYSNKRVVFQDFISYPDYLKITQIAYIGFLSYFPVSSSLSEILNVSFCAPNKIFEYSAYGLPMIANNIPSLNITFSQFNCGITIDSYNEKNIAETIMVIDKNYEYYSEGSKKYFHSISIKEKIIDLAK